MILSLLRLLRSFRVNIGFSTSAQPYGEWESPDCELRGHSLGHYLSAFSLKYASKGDVRFKLRLDYIVDQLSQCQSNSVAAGFHDGYLAAFPESFIDRVEQGKRVWGRGTRYIESWPGCLTPASIARTRRHWTCSRKWQTG